MTGSDHIFSIVAIKSICKSNDELIEKAYKEVLDHEKNERYTNEKYELNIEKKDIYVVKFDGTNEEKRKMYSSKCVVFCMPNLRFAPETERNTVRKLYTKQSELIGEEIVKSVVKMIIVYTEEESAAEGMLFMRFVTKKDNVKTEEKHKRVNQKPQRPKIRKIRHRK